MVSVAPSQRAHGRGVRSAFNGRSSPPSLSNNISSFLNAETTFPRSTKSCSTISAVIVPPIFPPIFPPTIDTGILPCIEVESDFIAGRRRVCPWSPALFGRYDKGKPQLHPGMPRHPKLYIVIPPHRWQHAPIAEIVIALTASSCGCSTNFIMSKTNLGLPLLNVITVASNGFDFFLPPVQDGSSISSFKFHSVLYMDASELNCRFSLSCILSSLFTLASLSSFVCRIRETSTLVPCKFPLLY